MFFSSRFLPGLVAVGLMLFMFSCRTANQIRYFKDLPDSAYVHLPHMPQEARQIQLGDRLQITVGGRNGETAQLFNNYGGVPTSGGLGQTGVGANLINSDIAGFWVDNDGMIEYPIIGRLKVEGLTTTDLKDTLTNRLAIYLKDPLVTVKFMSFKFTVLGEVRAPGTYVLSNQRTTLLDALGAAGDLPRTAKRYDIQLYRDYNGKRTIAKIDLRKKDILMNQDLFQIRNNDVILVQPRDVRLFSEEARNYISLISLLLTSAALVISVSNK